MSDVPVASECLQLASAWLRRKHRTTERRPNMVSLKELLRLERLTLTQHRRIQTGLYWAQRFGLIEAFTSRLDRFDTNDTKTMLVLSNILEIVKSTRKIEE